jgi:hypothetical protein
MFTVFNRYLIVSLAALLPALAIAVHFYRD